MRIPANISDLEKVHPDFMGFIFYGKSPRYVLEENNQEVIKNLSASIKKVGVFVNETVQNLIAKAHQFDLDLIQLHGGESKDYCDAVKHAGFEVIKVFSVKDRLPLEELSDFESVTDYFLFDTKTVHFGGSGVHFDWRILSDYALDKPYFLSGGIGEGDIIKIRQLHLPQLFALDINSKFENAPGEKNIELIKVFDKALY